MSLLPTMITLLSDVFFITLQSSNIEFKQRVVLLSYNINRCTSVPHLYFKWSKTLSEFKLDDLIQFLQLDDLIQVKTWWVTLNYKTRDLEMSKIFTKQLVSPNIYSFLNPCYRFLTWKSFYCIVFIVNRGYMYEGKYWKYIVNHASTRGQHGKDTPSHPLFTLVSVVWQPTPLSTLVKSGSPDLS